MKPTIVLLLALGASPAFAHHEAVVATSLVPLATNLAAMAIAGLAAWRLNRRSDKSKRLPRSERARPADKRTAT